MLDATLFILPFEIAKLEVLECEKDLRNLLLCMLPRSRKVGAPSVQNPNSSQRTQIITQPGTQRVKHATKTRGSKGKKSERELQWLSHSVHEEALFKLVILVIAQELCLPLVQGALQNALEQNGTSVFCFSRETF